MSAVVIQLLVQPLADEMADHASYDRSENC